MTTSSDIRRSKTLRDMGLLVLLAFLYRLLFILAIPQIVNSSDAILYLGVIQRFASGQFQGFDISIPILYPLLSAGVHHLIPDLEWSARSVSLFFSCLTPCVIYALTHRMYGRAAARVAGLIVAIWPWLADYGCSIAPESQAVFLWFSCILVVEKCVRKGGVWMLITPLVFYALHLTRAEGTLFLFAGPFLGLLLLRPRRKKDVLHLLPYIVLSIILLYVHMRFTEYASGVRSFAPRVSVDRLESYVYTRGIEIARTAIHTISHVLPIMTGIFLLLFAGAGFLGYPGKRRAIRIEILALAFAALQWVAAVISSFSSPRYLMAPVILLSMAAARGIVLSSQSVKQLRDIRRHLHHVPIILLVIMMFIGTLVAVLPEYAGRAPKTPVEYKKAGLWMRENLVPGLILCRKPQVGYYAEMPTTGPTEQDTPSSVVTRAQRAGARYLVIDERYTINIAPDLAPLLNPETAPSGLRMLKEDISSWPGARIVIYEVLPAPSQSGVLP